MVRPRRWWWAWWLWRWWWWWRFWRRWVGRSATLGWLCFHLSLSGLTIYIDHKHYRHHLVTIRFKKFKFQMKTNLWNLLRHSVFLFLYVWLFSFLFVCIMYYWLCDSKDVQKKFVLYFFCRLVVKQPRKGCAHKAEKSGDKGIRSSLLLRSPIDCSTRNILNIAKGTKDPRVEFISQVLTLILIKYQFQN